MRYESRDREIMMWTENERERETERGEGGVIYTLKNSILQVERFRL